MTIYFAVHDVDGKIQRYGSCPEEALSAQAPAGELVVSAPENVNHTDFYVIDGIVVAYTAEELQAKRNLAPGYIWKLPERIAFDTRALPQAKAMKLAAILRQCDAALQPIRSGYPTGEQQTWDKQEREARAFTADNQAETPMLTALAAARGITVEDLAARVIVKANAFAAYSGGVIGTRQRCEDEVDAATTVADVDAVTWGPV